MAQHQPNPPSVVRRLLEAVAVFGTATFAVWAVDVGAHLAVLQRVALGHQAQGSAADYAKLLFAETQVALLVTVLGFAIGLALVRVTGALAGHAVVSSSAFLSGIVMLADRHIVWNKTPGHDPLAFSLVGFTLAVVVAASVWTILALAARRRKDAPWGLERIFVYVFFPAVTVGFWNLALSGGDGGAGKVNLTTAIILLIVFVLATWLRSRIVRAVVAVLAVLGVGWLVSAAVAAHSSFGENGDHTKRARVRAPSVVLIVLDTVRADHLDLYGYDRDTMPRLSAWAAGATVFERAVTAGGWTAPAHASIFSGMPVSHHGIHYSASAGGFQTRPKKGIKWLPQKLSESGYYCLAVSANPLALPKAIKGFDLSLIPRRHPWFTSTVASLADHYSPLLRGFNERGRWRLPYMVADDIVATVRRATPSGDGPVFIFANFLDPHSPFNPPASALRELELDPPRIFNRYSSHREVTLAWPDLPAEKNEVVTDLYDAEIRGMDAPLERLLEWVDERFGKDTVVIVTSDHGEELGEDGRVGHEYGLGQNVIHVPLIVRCPWFEPGRRAEIVTTRALDKFIEAVGSGQRPTVESLGAADEFGIISERYASSHNIEHLGQAYNRNWISLFEGDYKAMGPSVNGFELFDINAQGFDTEEIVFDTSRGERLRERIDRYWETDFDRREKDVKFEPASEEELKRLRALGYIK